MNLGMADTPAYLGCSKDMSSSSQEQADTGAGDRKMMLQPQVLWQPSSPEGSYVQALDPRACPYPSHTAWSEPDAINRGRGPRGWGTRMVLAF